MVRKTATKLLALIILTASSVLTFGLPFRPDGVGPAVFDVSKSICLAGQSVNFNVGLSGEATGDETLTVSYSAGAFTSIPTELHPVSGQTSVSFNGTLSPLYAGLVTMTITGNGHTVTTSFFVLGLPF